MNPLSRVAKWLRGRDCERIIKRIGNEYKITGADLEGGGFTFKLGSFSNKIVPIITKPTDLAISIDDSQYQLCVTISNLKEGDLKDYCTRIRLQLILGINQWRALVSSIEKVPLEEVKKDLSEWTKFMNRLNKQSILLLKPGHRSIGKGKSAIELARITKFQNLEEKDVQEAINQMH
jgi:hypothetical protein